MKNKNYSKSESPSSTHANRKAHNWLIYKTIDIFLCKIGQSHIRGVLYDLGAGEAPYQRFFLRYAKQYIAVDWENSCHNSKPDIIADLNESLPIADAVADTVVSLSVLEHLREPKVMLHEAHRILKPGGFLVLQVPWQWWVHESPHDFFRYTPYGLEYVLHDAGFNEVFIEPQAGFFTTMILKANYFSLRFIRGPRLLRRISRLLLGVAWYCGQKLAPFLDKLDRDWTLEAPGYFVTAKKK